MSKYYNDYYVYELRRPSTNEPFYIGIGRGKRIQVHEKLAKRKAHQNKHVEHIIAKEGGWVDKEKIAESLTLSQAQTLEVLWIDFYGRRVVDPDGILANLTTGGEGARHSPSSIEKMRKVKAGKVRSDSDKCRRIVEMYKSGKSLVEIAGLFKISIPTVYKILDDYEVDRSCFNLRQKEPAIIEDYKNGLPYAVLLPKHGISYNQLDRLRRKNSLDVRLNVKKPIPFDETTMISLLEEGNNQKQIANLMGYHPSNISRHFSRLGLN